MCTPILRGPTKGEGEGGHLQDAHNEHHDSGQHHHNHNDQHDDGLRLVLLHQEVDELLAHDGGTQT